MLSKCCDGCYLRYRCETQFESVKKGEFVYCPDGSRNLVDE
jgi:hypothetical protein